MNSISASILIIFCADWCDPCKHLEAELKQPDTASIVQQFQVFHVDIDTRDGKRLARLWKVDSVPTLIVARRTKDGKALEVSRCVGWHGGEKLREWLAETRKDRQ